jgi:hypothetical protein
MLQVIEDFGDVRVGMPVLFDNTFRAIVEFVAWDYCTIRCSDGDIALVTDVGDIQYENGEVEEPKPLINLVVKGVGAI